MYFPYLNATYFSHNIYTLWHESLILIIQYFTRVTYTLNCRIENTETSTEESSEEEDEEEDENSGEAAFDSSLIIHLMNSHLVIN